MRFVEIEMPQGKILTLCEKSVIKEIYKQKTGPLIMIGNNILLHKTYQIGLANSFEEAKKKYPEYFI